MDIKEIALRIGEEADEYADAKLQSKGEFHPDWHTVRDEYFAEALIAEIAKQNEPVAWARYPKFTGSTQRQEVVFKKPDDLHNWVCLHALPPTAEQIANETAEAIAKYFEQSGIGGDCLAEGVRSGAWKEFKK